MKKKTALLNIVGLLVLTLLLFPAHLFAQSNNSPVSIELMPGKYVSIKGDVEKFRAHHWMSDGFAAGIKHLSLERDIPGDTHVTFEGHAIQQENDIGGDLLLKNDNFGTVHVDYKSFRKYYDGSGGYYDAFTTLNSPELDNELHMDLGNLLVEISPTFGDLYDVTFLYEHHTKEGTKSRLTWAEVEESVTRKISPVPQDISETTDVLAIEGATTFAGFDVSGEQRYEKTESSMVRVERDLSTTTTAADKRVRIQFQDPTAEIYRTTLQGERWFNEDKTFLGVAYRYQSLENDELENIIETTEAGVRTNSFSRPKQKVNAYAQNAVDAHTLVGNFMTKLSDVLSVSSKFKTEYMTRDGEAFYPEDDAPSTPDTLVDDAEANDTRNRVMRWGQSVGLRYSGIKHARLYLDADFGQIDNNIKEEQHNLAGDLLWNRHTKAYSTSSNLTAGARLIPSKKVNLTTQIKRIFENNDYDHAVQNRDSGINSAFFDSLKKYAYEAVVKLTWKPIKKLQNSLRYQLQDSKFEARVEGQDKQESDTLSQILTYDLSTQPLTDLLLNFAVSQQWFKTETAAGASTSDHVPGFKADVQSILFSASYFPSEELSYIGTFVYSHSDNFNDFIAFGLPLGVSSAQYNGQFGMKWSPKDKDWSVEPHYAYYSYDTDAPTETGDYSAHVGWIDFAFQW